MPRRAKLTTDVEAWEHGPPADCSLAAQGLLTRMRMYMLRSERPGHLLIQGKPMSTETLAKRVGDSIDHVRSLQEELLDKAALMRGEGGALYDPQMVGELERRQRGVERTRQWRERGASRDSARDTSRDRGCDAKSPSRDSARDASPPPPPFPSPSHTLPLPLTPSPVPNSSNSGDGVPPVAVMDEGKKTPAKKPRAGQGGRVLTGEQEQTRRAFGDWWCGIYPRFHNGQLFDFVGSRDGPAILDLMRRQQVHWDLDRAKAVAEYYLGLWEGYFPDHPLWSLAKRANYFARKIDERKQFGESHVLRPTGTDASSARTAHADGGGTAGAGGIRQTPLLGVRRGAAR